MKPNAIVLDRDVRIHLAAALEDLGLEVSDGTTIPESCRSVVEGVARVCGEKDQLVVVMLPEDGEREFRVGMTLEEMERVLILKTLDSTGWNRARAARILGVTARTLANKLKTWRTRGLVAAEVPASS